MTNQRRLKLLSVTLILCQSWGDNATEVSDNEQVDIPIRKCRERDRLTASDDEDYFSLVDVPIGKTFVLQCHFCGENDDKEPKVWYKQKTIQNSKPEEVALDMDNNITRSRVHVNLEHSLTIRNVTSEDSGLYLCEGTEGQESEQKFNYYVDIVYEQNASVETGDEEVWRKYHEENLYPINKLFRASSGSEFVRLREEVGLTVELFTDWDSWTPCDACGKPVGKGITQREGYCRIKIIPINKNTALSKCRNEAEKNLINMNRVSCSSSAFFTFYPYIGSLTRVLPDFREIKFCKGDKNSQDKNRTGCITCKPK